MVAIPPYINVRQIEFGAADPTFPPSFSTEVIDRPRPRLRKAEVFAQIGPICNSVLLGAQSVALVSTSLSCLGSSLIRFARLADFWERVSVISVLAMLSLRLCGPPPSGVRRRREFRRAVIRRVTRGVIRS